MLPARLLPWGGALLSVKRYSLSATVLSCLTAYVASSIDYEGDYLHIHPFNCCFFHSITARRNIAQSDGAFRQHA